MRVSQMKYDSGIIKKTYIDQNGAYPTCKLKWTILFKMGHSPDKDEIIRDNFAR